MENTPHGGPKDPSTFQSKRFGVRNIGGRSREQGKKN
jgi:hypothetical protein